MGFSIQDSETGEFDYIRSDLNETVHRLEYDNETGEPLKDELKVRYTKLEKFRIPKTLLKAGGCEKFINQLTGEDQCNEETNEIQYTFVDEILEDNKQRKQHFNSDDYMNMEGVQNDIILAYKKSNILLFLIPTLFFYNIYVALLYSLIEIFLHFWSHKKNALNMNKNIYFQSPLHVLTSQFCATCRWEQQQKYFIYLMSK